MVFQTRVVEGEPMGVFPGEYTTLQKHNEAFTQGTPRTASFLNMTCPGRLRVFENHSTLPVQRLSSYPAIPDFRRSAICEMRMTRLLDLGRKHGRFLFPLVVLSFLSVASLAQTPAPRISAAIDNAHRITIPGTHPPMARQANDTGQVPSGTKLGGISIVFSRTASQEATLQALIAEQQHSSSASYHKWLTPEEFANQFGVADSDISKVESWLEEEGFAVDGVSRSKNRVTFSGTAGQVAAAFGTELHYYTVDDQVHYAPSKDLSVPAALSSVVQSIMNLSSFRPKPRVKAKPSFTSSQSGKNFLTPKDVATVYDIAAAYNSGYTGTGQSIAVVGQSEVYLSDVENFQNAAGHTVKYPILVLVPDSGSPAVSSGDEAESDLDMEYSGGIATGATIYLVYVGDNTNYSVWDSINYAVDTLIAPIISASYGDCETDLGSNNYATLNSILEQAAAQGQSVIAASGDNGSTDCYGYSNLTTAQQEALAVDFPSDSQYVTGIGGTEFPSADINGGSNSSTYWESANGADVISSALSYIPEQVWNDDSSSNGISSGGGGISTLTARPSWQTGVTGIPSGGYRLVPDISLAASLSNPGYLYCTSDSSYWSSGQQASCNSGFRDSSTEYLTVAGGTSFGAPIFAGMLAIINQKLHSTGQGVVNSTLYTLAADTTTYASAFHDITSGGNQCTAGSSYCSTAGESEYPATTGYDEASGLGSLDFANLLGAWPTIPASSLQPSITTLSAATSTPASGADDTITVTLASGSTSSTTTPTGTLTIEVDGTTETSSLALTDGSATYTFSSSTTGSHVVTATYSGDSTYAPSTGTLALTVGGSSSSGSFSLAATNLTVSAGTSGTSTITITPQNGYTGTIGWSVSTSSSLSNACYSLSDATVSGTSAVTTTMTVHTSESACANASAKGSNGKRLFTGGVIRSGLNNHPTSGLNAAKAGMSMGIVLLAGLLGYRPKKFRAYAGVFLIAALTFGISACGSGSSSSSTNAAKGTYTLTIAGTDTSSSSITASTTMTLTID
jgi:subtilase family serine protease